MLLDLVLLATGLGLLLLGGEWLVRGAVALAGRFGLPPLLIGLTVVGFGTSMPELLVSLQAARVGSPDIAVGNVVGSNIANILLILGVAAVISPVAARIPGLNRDLLMMTAVAVLTLALGWFGLVSRVFGFAMVAVLLVYLTTIYLLDRNNPQEDQDDAATDLPLWRTLLSLFGGLAGLFIGADLLVDTATKIARDFGISEAVIGLTIVAIGTSLPELATSVVAAFRKQSQVALGNVGADRGADFRFRYSLDAGGHRVHRGADLRAGTHRPDRRHCHADGLWRLHGMALLIAIAQQPLLLRAKPV
jgi:cation:H+ antiporter